MPIRYLGHYDCLADGKFLLEILTQMRNLGVGRCVTKQEWLRRWPNQPSYCVIRKVEPNMDRWLWRGRVWADWVFRGKNLGVFVFEKDLHRPDWKLIHKREEEKFRKCDHPLTEIRVPSKLPMPPLMRFMEEQKAGSSGGESQMLDVVHFVDAEHDHLKPLMRKDPSLNPKPGGSIYDVDPSIYFDLYGTELPTKIEDWGTSNESGLKILGESEEKTDKSLNF